jgi:hypothetical protein
MRWESRRFSAWRFAFSVSTERWLIVVAAGDGLSIASAAAARTAACRSAWRWMNERCTPARSDIDAAPLGDDIAVVVDDPQDPCGQSAASLLEDRFGRNVLATHVKVVRRPRLPVHQGG